MTSSETTPAGNAAAEPTTAAETSSAKTTLPPFPAIPPKAVVASPDNKAAVVKTAPAKRAVVKTAAAKPAPRKASATAKPAVKAVPKTATKAEAPSKAAAAKPPTKSAPAKPATKSAGKAEAPAKAGAAAKAKPAVKLEVASDKKKKPKMVRDSFTIPKAEYVVLAELKQRALDLKVPVKKTELLRAGIKLLAALSDTAFTAAIAQVPSLKTGRPSKN